MVEKIVLDLASTQKEFNKWWDTIANKYGLDKSKLKHYQVDFEDGSLYWIEEEAS